MTGYIYGLDPASKNDFFGIVVHELKDMPKLRAINQLNHTSFDRLYSYLVDSMFERYPRGTSASTTATKRPSRTCW